MTNIIYDYILDELRLQDTASIPDPLFVNNLGVKSLASINLLNVNGIQASLISTNQINSSNAYLSTASIGNLGLVNLQWDLVNGNGTAEGQMSWDAVNQTVALGMAGGNVDVALGLETLFPKRVRNSTGSTMPKGTAVYINGVSGNTPTVDRAIATSDMTSAYTLGLTAESINNNSTGWVTTFGELTGINLSAYTGGDTLYLSPVSLGLFTNVKPSAPDHYVRLGTVVKATTDGILVVNVINGFETDELHDVQLSSLASGHILISNGSLWQNKSLATVNSYLSLSSLAVRDSLNFYELVSYPSLGSLSIRNNLNFYELVSYPSLGSLSIRNTLNFTDLVSYPSLGSLSIRNNLNFFELVSYPSLGSLSVRNTLNFTDLVSYPSLGSLAILNALSFFSLLSRPSLGTLSTLNELSYSSLISRPSLGTLSTLNVLTHGSAVSLLIDDHTQYALLAGRSGGQTLNGGNASGNNFTIDSTSNATKGNIILNPSGGNVYIGTASLSIVDGVLGTMAGLFVQGSGTNAGYISSRRNANTVGFGTGFAAVLNNSANTPVAYSYYNGYIISNASGSESGGIAFFTRNNGTLTEKVRIDNTGNVGIGTTAPTSELTVGTSFASINGITVDTGNTTDSALVLRKSASKPAFGILPWDNEVYLSAGMYYDGGWVHHSSNNQNQVVRFTPSIGVTWYASSTASASFNVANGVTLWDDFARWKSSIQSTRSDTNYITGGNFGVGTSTPQSVLDVNSPLNGYISIGRSLSMASGQFSGIHFGYREENTSYRKSALVFERIDSSARGKIHILNNNDATSGSAILSDSRITIDSDGDIGISQRNPLGRLHINAPQNAIVLEKSLASAGAVGPFMYVQDNGQTSAGVNSSEFGFFVAGVGSSSSNDGSYFLMRGSTFSRLANQRGHINFSAGAISLASGRDGSITFSTGNSERLAIMPNGYIGAGTITPDDNFVLDIGTADPDRGLTIKGTSNSFGDIGVKIENTGSGGNTWYIDSTNDGSGYGGGKLVFNSGIIGAINTLTLTRDGNAVVGSVTDSGRFTVFNDDTARIGQVIRHAGGTNDYLQVLNQTTGATIFEIDERGRVGVGKSPASWLTSYNVMQVRNSAIYGSSDANHYFSSNYFADTSGVTRYLSTGGAGVVGFTNGVFEVYGAVSGLSGASLPIVRTAQLGINQTLALQGATSQSGTGISFPTTFNSSTNANTLDDYEEGNFTPTVRGSIVAGTGTYTTQNGRYTKVGRVVHYEGYVVWTNLSGASGALLIGGLPFSSASTATFAPVTLGYVQNVTLPANSVLTAYVRNAETNINLQTYPLGGGAITNLALDTAGELIFGGSYTTAT